MKKLWWFLVDGCFHKWEEISHGPLTYKGLIVGDYFIHKCSKCGKHKQESVF